ncbi:protein FLX-like 1 [Vitis riparia]|uniref:protein FLX-like 1 n=1 Tax=Vitis riparia TaxID=96939 RepID=UPI00155B3A20|nr:protein FLX-like 1 [Vitis riparia]
MGVKHDLQRARAAIEYEKNGYAENYQHGQLMENNLISMARELEKLRAEFANADKGASAAAPGGNPGYSGNYGGPETGYAANSYLTNYGMNPILASAESFPQYEPGPGSWGAYNKQQLS